MSLILLAIGFGGYAGYKIRKEYNYVDKDDVEKYYFYGISKKVWVCILLSISPVLNFLTEFTNVYIYKITDKIANSRHFWFSLFGIESVPTNDSSFEFSDLIIGVLILFFLWAIWISGLIYGVKTIKERQKPHRKLIISLIFIVLPLLVIVIPIIRNRTWFY